MVVIGGGPAGMIAAGIAAESGAKVTLLEKNEKLGKKLYITGKGRCNVTNNTDIAGLLGQTMSNPRFMQSAFHALDAAALMAFFESLGTPLKTERGGRVFPISDKADDITKALEKYMRRGGVKVLLNTAVQEILPTGGEFEIRTENRNFTADALVVATGGLSYPSTGATGDGYKFAKAFGHAVTPTFPSLVPLNVAEPWVADLTGLSLRNVKCTVRQPGGKPAVLYEEAGEMLFTPTGITGPIILRASAYLTQKLDGKTPILMEIDLKPALSFEQLDARILRDFALHQNRHFANALDGLLPQRLIQTVIALSGIAPDKKVNAITKQERHNLVGVLKALPLTPTKTAGYREAVITKGGVAVKEINPSTMMSKMQPGLFFAGEVLDVDAMTGGYNLQIAFSTGYLAGLCAAEFIK